MIRPAALGFAAALLLGACAGGRTDTAMLPAAVYGAADADDKAIYDALIFFRALGRTGAAQPTVARAARALAEVEYLGGAVSTDEHFRSVKGEVQVQMLQARDEVRRVLAVAPAARSQDVVDALFAVSLATTPAAQQAALASAVFTLGAAGTASRLSALPAMPVSLRALEQLWSREFRMYDAP